VANDRTRPPTLADLGLTKKESVAAQQVHVSQPPAAGGPCDPAPGLLCRAPAAGGPVSPPRQHQRQQARRARGRRQRGAARAVRSGLIRTARYGTRPKIIVLQILPRARISAKGWKSISPLCVENCRYQRQFYGARAAGATGAASPASLKILEMALTPTPAPGSAHRAGWTRSARSAAAGERGRPVRHTAGNVPHNAKPQQRKKAHLEGWARRRRVA
jgi:hypothetical protein